jgi:hypothetical protein
MKTKNTGEFLGEYTENCVLSKSLFVHCRRVRSGVIGVPFKGVSGANRVS